MEEGERALAELGGEVLAWEKKGGRKRGRGDEPRDDRRPSEEEHPNTIPAFPVRFNHFILIRYPILIPTIERSGVVYAEDVDGLTDIIGNVRDTGVAVAMVEHHMHVVLGLADRVAVLHHGQLLPPAHPCVLAKAGTNAWSIDAW